MENFVTVSNILLGLFGISGIIGAFFTIRNTRRAAIVAIQDQTIEALQQQINALKAGQEAMQKENDHLKIIIETISSALKQKGIVISVEGEMVVVEDGRNRTSSMRHSTRTPVPPSKKIISHDDVS